MFKFFKKLWDNLDGGNSETQVTQPAEDERERRFNYIKEIPICGNAFTTNSDKNDCDCRGFEHWASPQTTWTIFFRVSQPETIGITLRLRIPKRSHSTFRFYWDDENTSTKEISISDPMGGEYQNVWLGHRQVQRAGHVRLNLEGVHRSGRVFAEVSHLLVSHDVEDNEIIFNCTEESHFGRRGPSVHLWYPIPPEARSIEYYYNEVTVPCGSDARGMYAMAVGFTGGYFGIQVNTPPERRVLFSIWSECNTDDPCQIPEDQQVVLLKKGEGVHVGEFGNEGSGGQSYKRVNWVSGTTYKFLVHGRPIDGENTLFSAWFKRPESAEWELVASFRKPKVSHYLEGFYSFLENFEPDHGHCERTAYYGNQWVRDSMGNWYECSEARFTGDATSKAGRRDFAGGCVCTNDGNTCFYLRHCGFFDNLVPTGQSFFRVPSGRIPDVSIESLP